MVKFKFPSIQNLGLALFLGLVFLQAILKAGEALGLLDESPQLGIPIILFVFSLVFWSMFKLVISKGAALERRDVFVIVLLIAVGIAAYFFLDQFDLLPVEGSIVSQSILSLVPPP